MPVSFVAANTGSSGFGTTVQVTINSGNAGNRYVAANPLSVELAPVTFVSVTANGDPMSLFAGPSSNPDANVFVVQDALFELLNPDAGSQVVEVTFNPSIDVAAAMSAVVYSDVDQTTPRGNVVSNFVHVVTSSQNITANIADAVAGDIIVAYVYAQKDAGNVTTISGGSVRTQSAGDATSVLAVLEFNAPTNAPTITATIADTAATVDINALLRAYKLNAVSYVGSGNATQGQSADASGSLNVQFLSPSANVSAGMWLASDGISGLYQMIDEFTPNSDDYAYVQIDQGASNFTVQLQAANDPQVSHGHVVRYQIRGDGACMAVSLLDGANVIATWTHNPPPANLTTYVQELTGNQANSILNYANLRLTFGATP